MIELKEIDSRVEKVLTISTVGRAQKILQSRGGIWMIAAIAFIESALPLPILTDPFLVASILLNRKKSLEIIIITIVSSVMGGVVAFFSALFFLEVVLSFMTPGMVQQFQSIVSNTETNIFVLTIIGAVTPVPYTLVAWAVAVLQGGLITFIVASVLGRTVRYAIVGYCVYRFGPTAMQYARRYVGLTSLVILILAIAFVWYKM